MLPLRKVALLTVVAVGCGLLALACLVYAVWCAVTARHAPRVGWLPEGPPTTFPPRAVVLAAWPDVSATCSPSPPPTPA